MSRRNKLQKFNELLSNPLVYENFNTADATLHWNTQDQVIRKGCWNTEHFHNALPITLELACGGGEYTVALAKANPERNFIGIDIKGARIWKGATQALDEQLTNVAFLRTRIEIIEQFFGENEVDEIWITFPDPFLRESKSNKRLTSPPFLERYRKILKPNAIVHLKTDSPELYDFTMETLQSDPRSKIIYNNADIYAGPLLDDALLIKTKYELMHLAVGKTIKYIRFSL
ncbi:MAG: tRNA (guanosine(46)-N7)-methyltransferase TrmB [Saprospiraceae bacterium]|nr:tRNA (guanosine(46)-N7)-methyltransferase TrmB [Saprospiraceae bacterium]